jgi:hypothetical protein
VVNIAKQVHDHDTAGVDKSVGTIAGGEAKAPRKSAAMTLSHRLDSSILSMNLGLPDPESSYKKRNLPIAKTTSLGSVRIMPIAESHPLHARRTHPSTVVRVSGVVSGSCLGDQPRHRELLSFVPI